MIFALTPIYNGLESFLCKIITWDTATLSEILFLFFYFFYKKISNFINKNHFGTYNTPSKSYSKSSNHTLASSKSMFIYVLGNKIMIDLNADCKADFFFFF